VHNFTIATHVNQRRFQSVRNTIHDSEIFFNSGSLSDNESAV
jgi:hypothetical protein